MEWQTEGPATGLGSAGVLAVEFEAKNKNLDVFEFDVPIRTGLKAQQEINQAFKFINIFKIRIF